MSRRSYSQLAPFAPFVTAAALAFLAHGSTSCSSNPVHADEVDRLGDERDGVPQGEYHRAGQPCLTCHGFFGPSDTEFVVAGTVFAGGDPKRQIGLERAEVRLTDSGGTKWIARTNCVGNFFVKPSDWQPQFPILVEVGKGGTRRAMKSTIGRDGSCATCHTAESGATYQQVGQVFLYSGDDPGAPEGATDCPVSPKLRVEANTTP